MGFREILEFVKIEHMLFSLPFVLIGALIAVDIEPSNLAVLDIMWILIAAVGARGLAMTLNRIIHARLTVIFPQARCPSELHGRSRWCSWRCCSRAHGN